VHSGVHAVFGLMGILVLVRSSAPWVFWCSCGLRIRVHSGAHAVFGSVGILVLARSSAYRIFWRSRGLWFCTHIFRVAQHLSDL